jgi:hypothetical protein
VGGAVYHITVVQTPAGNGEMRVSVDGVEQHDRTIPLVDDHKEHWVEVRMHVTGGSSLLSGRNEIT